MEKLVDVEAHECLLESRMGDALYREMIDIIISRIKNHGTSAASTK